MMLVEELNQKYGIENHLTFSNHKHTIVAKVANAHSTAVVSLYGAQVLSFIPTGERDVLFVSEESYFEHGKAIRGGIPICWPWFGPHFNDRNKPSHGFARLSDWQVVHTSFVGGNVVIQLQLTDSAYTKQLWPYAFETLVTISVGKRLSVELTTTNRDKCAFTISSALHSYLHVSDCEKITLYGLSNIKYIKSGEDTQNLQADHLLRFSGEIDRGYIQTSGDCIIDDSGFNRKITIAKRGSLTTVVWNPGAQLALKMKDLGDQEYQSMVCVEAANALNNLVVVAPDESHTLATQIYPM